MAADRRSSPPLPDLSPALLSRTPRPDPLTGHTFQNPALLRDALTHSSLAYESNLAQGIGPSTRSAFAEPQSADPGSTQRTDDYEQLEFLGDAVLSLVVADALFRALPGNREGDLTRLRASLVSREHLASVATRLDLGRHLRLGRGEERTGGRRKPALLADALEAVIAALYLDAGLPSAASFITREIIAPSLPSLRESLRGGGAIGDYKTALQERVQALGHRSPRYTLLESSGPDHNRSFRVTVEFENSSGTLTRLAEGTGPSKKRAEQEAARTGLAALLANPEASSAASATPGDRPA